MTSTGAAHTAEANRRAESRRRRSLSRGAGSGRLPGFGVSRSNGYIWGGHPAQEAALAPRDKACDGEESTHRAQLLRSRDRDNNHVKAASISKINF